MLSRRLLFSLALLLALTATPHTRAQQTKPKPSPTPKPTQTPREDQEPVKIFTEEVRLPIVAFDDYGHFDPTLTTDDLLVLEDGVQQEIKSIRHIPANVLFLLDVDGQMTLAKSTATTREIALRLLARLRAGDQVSVIQYGGRVETLQDWTSDYEAVRRVLKTKLSGGKRGRLSEAVAAAAAQLKDRPAGSRHVVLITDGIETPGGKLSLNESIKQLVAAQATVHIISYTTLVQQAIGQRYKHGVVGPGTGQQKDASVRDNPTMPSTMNRNPTFTLGTIDTDRAMRRWYKNYANGAKESEQRLVSLAEETGGEILLPTTTDEMIAKADEVARDIGAQYVITYKPKRPLSEATAGEYRRLEVAPRRTGVRIRARRGYLIAATQ